jgi:hypothetical protein
MNGAPEIWWVGHPPETRANDIRNGKGYDASKDTVLVAGVSSLKDFQGVINQANGMEKQFGKVGEVDLFSHAGGVDGPNFNYGHNKPGGTHYTNEQNMAGLLGTKVNWASNAQAGFYGCNTATATLGASNFAQQFANAQHVPTYGFSSPANFSSSPNSINLFDYFHIGTRNTWSIIQVIRLSEGTPSDYAFDEKQNGIRLACSRVCGAVVDASFGSRAHEDPAKPTNAASTRNYFQSAAREVAGACRANDPARHTFTELFFLLKSTTNFSGGGRTDMQPPSS